MTRINLSNYRAKEIYYKKLRLFWLLFITILVALFINAFIYVYYQFKIMHQETRNAYLITNISILDERLKPIDEYNTRLKFLQQQLALLVEAENLRDDMLSFCQHINKITPPQIYYTQINWESNTVNFNGVAPSPLYLANLLDKLRDESGIFYAPVLKTNSATDKDHYTFMITSSIKTNLEAESNGK